MAALGTVTQAPQEAFASAEARRLGALDACILPGDGEDAE